MIQRFKVIRVIRVESYWCVETLFLVKRPDVRTKKSDDSDGMPTCRESMPANMYVQSVLEVAEDTLKLNF